ncbi:MAG TPA: hypothetical protein VML95_10395 [Longimicrobiales bacterium]|nr:hypothetical protein [Longimicrobiales bacterium]
MHEILRKRILRRLEALPEGKLYQILDYIEFIESRYGEPSATPSGLQSFAERLEDRMRARSVVPSVMSGTMKVFGAAGKVLDEVSSVGRGLVEGIGEGLSQPGPGPGQPGPSQPAGPRPVRDTGTAIGGATAPATAAPAPAAAAPAAAEPDADGTGFARRRDGDDKAPAGPVLADDGDDQQPA